MPGEGRQLAFDLPHRPATGRDDFLVTPSNAKAVALIDLWPNWPANTLALLGPPGSGKSHLAAVWHEMTGAVIAGPSGISKDAVPRLLDKGALVIEDAPGGDLDEPAFFHLLNLAREQKAYVLITAQQASGPSLKVRQSAHAGTSAAASGLWRACPTKSETSFRQ